MLCFFKARLFLIITIGISMIIIDLPIIIKCAHSLCPELVIFMYKFGDFKNKRKGNLVSAWCIPSSMTISL